MTISVWRRWINRLRKTVRAPWRHFDSRKTKRLRLFVETLEDRTAPAAFTAGNLAVLDLAAASTNTTGSILELSPATAGQSSPVQTIPVSSMYFSDSGTSSFLSDTSDGSLLAFGAYNTQNQTVTITNASWASGIETITATNNFAVNNSVTLAGMTPSAGDGTFTIATVTGTTKFTYAAAANPGFTAYGTATSLPTDLADITASNARGVGTLDASGTFNLAASYTESISGDQTRAATSADDMNFYVTDKGGLFTNGAATSSIGTNNVLDTRSFGGAGYVSSTSTETSTITAASWATGVETITAPNAYVVGQTVTLAGMTPSAGNGTFTITGATNANFTYAAASNPLFTAFGTAKSNLAAVSTASSPPSTSALTALPGIAPDSNIQDFYLIQSGQNGSTYDILYTLDANDKINKLSLVSGTWTANGTYTMPNAGLSMIAENNGAGGAYLYATTGAILEQFTDTAGYNTAIDITASPVTLFTAATGNFIKGIALVPSSAAAPTVSNPTKSSIGINSATLGGTVTSTGSQYVTGYGVVYSLTSVNPNPIIGGTGVTQLPGSGVPVFAPFTVSATGLQGTSGYSYAAYATNSVGASYSSVDTFSTQSANPPSVDTPTDTAITASSATLGGTVESNGGANLTKNGVVYALTSQNSNPQLNGSNVVEVDFMGGLGALPASFTVPATGLTPGAGYTFEAFATNSSGTTYTAATAFTTLAAPTVNSPTFAGIFSNSATLGGNVVSNGGSTDTKTGVVYALTSANSNPQIGGAGVIEVDTASPVNSGAFTASVTGLTASTSYTFEAFATNGVGTTYTAATTFTTAAPGIIASWTFPAVVAAPEDSPSPTYGTGTATTLGMTNTYNGGNTASDDVLVTAGTANTNFSENTWRIRGTAHNGWSTYQNGAGAPEYSQGIELDASTVGYANIVFSFDWYSTTQGIRDLQVQYNTGGGWVNYQGPSPTGTFVATSNDFYNAGLSPVSPTITIDISGVAAANNNPNLGIRLVSAFDSTGTLGNEYASAASAPGAIVAYNNNSGNWRFGNLTFAAGTTTSTKVAASPAGSQNHGSNVIFTATVTPASGAQYPRGAVAFYDGSTQIGSTQNVTGVGSTNVGTASITLNTLAAGVHGDITAQYIPTPGNNLIASGSSMNLAAGDPTDNPISYTINAPQATGVDVSPVVGQPFTGVVATFSDGAAINPSDFSATIDWGDGHVSNGVIAFASSIDETNINGAIVNVTLLTVTGTDTYTATGSYPLSVTITDANNNQTTVTPTARVAYPPLIVTGVAAVNAVAGLTRTDETVATFTDPGLVASLAALNISDPTTQFSASINWGDHIVTTGTISFNSSTKIFSVIGSHTYAQAGAYSIAVAVTPLTVSVERIDSSDPNGLNEVGDENGNSLTDSPSPDFIDQFVIGAANQAGSLYTFSLPALATISGNEALTNSSYSVSEGELTLSTNGQTLVTGGYNDTVSLWAPQQTFSPASVLNRVIGTISGTGVINTTTDLTDAYTGDNFRGVVSTDGTQFWTSGHSGDGTSDYIHYAQLGATTSTIITGPNSLPDNPENINTVEIFNGQLYEGVRSAGGTTAPAGIYQIGNGLPTAAGQAETLFIQVPQSNPLDVGASDKPMDPFGFYLADLNDGNPTINGVNVAYVADAEMGIARYDYTNSGWQFSYYIDSTGSFLDYAYTLDSQGDITATGNFNPANPAASADPTKAGGVRELTGRVVNGQVQLFAVTGFGTTAQPNPGESLIEVTDTGASAGFTTLATDTGASELTGVAFTPSQNVTDSLTLVNAAPTGASNTVTMLEDHSYTFAAADFGFSDPNNTPANNLKAVEITTLTGAGSLTDNGAPVSAGQFISAADIGNNLLQFTPATNATGLPYITFTFQVQDDGGTANGGVDTDPTPKSMTIDVLASDSFNRPDSPNLGPNWTTQAGTFGVSALTAVNSPTTASDATLNNVSMTDAIVQADVALTAAGSYAGLLARYSGTGDGSSNFYLGSVYFDPMTGKYEANIFLKQSGQSYQPLGPSTDLTGVFTGAATLRFEVVGNQMKLFVNNKLEVVVYDSTITTAGATGMRGQDSSLANFSAVAVVSQTATLPFTDDFTNAVNGSDLDRVWREQAGAFTIQSNAAAAAAASIVPGDSLATLNAAPVADAVVQADVTLTAAGSYAGLIARYSGTGEFSSSFYLGSVYLNPMTGKYEANIFLKQSGQSYQPLAPTADLTGVFTGAGTLRLELLGTQLKLFINNTLEVVTHDSTIATAGAVGFRGLQASIDNFSATANASQTTTLPFTDDFTNTSGAELAPVWSENAGALSIQNDAAVGTAIVPNASLATLNATAAADTIVQANIALTAGGSYAGLMARYSGTGEISGNFYLGSVYLNPTTGKYEANVFLKQSGQPYQPLGPTVDLTGVFTGAGTLRFEVLGNELKLYVNNILEVVAQDSTIPTAGAVGFRVFQATLDTFSAVAAPALSTAVPYTDTFNTPANPPDLDRTWTEQVGAFSTQNSNAAAIGSGAGIATLNTGALGDASVQASVNVATIGSYAGLVARYSGPGENNFYLAEIYNNGGVYQASIYLKEPTGFVKLAEQDLSGFAGTGALEFDLTGTSLTLLVDGVQKASATDATLAAGLVGMRAFGASLDDFNVS